MNRALLAELLSQAGIEIKEEQEKQFETYYAELMAGNRKANLTALKDAQEIVVKHFYDSLLAMSTEHWKGKGTMLDLGTGAGFPGVPLKIMCPQVRVVLADSLLKRVAFLEKLIDRLDLKDITAVHGRAEEMGRNNEYRGRYDCVVSRAVAKMPILLEYALPFLKTGGCFFAYKGPGSAEELRSAERALEILGGRIIEIREHTLPLDMGKRTIIVIEKAKSTPEQYPRKPGLPEKRPL